MWIKYINNNNKTNLQVSLSGKTWPMLLKSLITAPTAEFFLPRGNHCAEFHIVILWPSPL